MRYSKLPGAALVVCAAAFIVVSGPNPGVHAANVNPDGIRPRPITPFSEQPCPNAQPDDWNTWAHDYARTSASSLELGDPANIRLAWLSPASGEQSRYTDPTAASGRVYLATDHGRNVFREFDGVRFSYPPHIDDLLHWTNDCRSSMTVHDGSVYQVTGNSGHLRKWAPNLANLEWSTQYNGALGQSALGPMRFGATVVTEIQGDEVVVFGSEYGYLSALNTDDGSVYSGWSNNPVQLQGGLMHSPSFDGEDLYIATAERATLRRGTICRIDLETGNIVWQTTSAMRPDQGFPGGVSVDDEFVYAAGLDDMFYGTRMKLRKSDGAIVWEHWQGRNLYAAPTIGRRYLYIPQSWPHFRGVLAIDKSTGAEVYNWADDGVGAVTQSITLTCDGYLFAGDVNGNWWCLDANNFTVAHMEQFDGMVNGTALTSGPNGEVYALVGLRSHFPYGGGIAAFRLDELGPEVSSNLSSSIKDLTSALDALYGNGAGKTYADMDSDGTLSILDVALMVESMSVETVATDSVERVK